jgi:hypothetical protein
MPVGVCRHRCRCARKASTWAGAACISALSGSGAGFFAGEAAALDGTGSPLGRSLVGAETSVELMVAGSLVEEDEEDEEKGRGTGRDGSSRLSSELVWSVLVFVSAGRVMSIKGGIRCCYPLSQSDVLC